MNEKIYRKIHLREGDCDDDVCIRPFCYCRGNIMPYRICEGCFDDLCEIVGGQDKVFDYRKEPAKARLTIKEAMELLIANNGGCQFQDMLAVDIKVTTTKKAIEPPKSQNDEDLTVE
jgi:hypothetical protein